MKVSDDLTALVFELQRVRSPADKAKALARAWRTLRGLSNDERRLLIREVGFDGAEDLVEGLAGKSGGLFAPAAVLEALGRIRNDESFTVRGVVADLRDRERREDLFMRGIDLIAKGQDNNGGGEVEPLADAVLEGDEDRLEPGPPEIVDTGIDPEEATDRVAVKPTVMMPPLPPGGKDPRDELPAVVEDVGEDDSEPRPEPVVQAEDLSTWDEQWAMPPRSVPASEGFDRPSTTPAPEEAAPAGGAAAGSVFRRLQAFRRAMGDLRGAGFRALIDALDGLPEAWAKRRAVVALLEAGIPADAGVALDVIERLERPMDRVWCLSALARRGALEGADLERALGMLESPAARRRMRSLAGL
jgi:hypothetical protein